MTRRVGLGLLAWVLLARLTCAQVAPAATMIRDVAPGSGVLVVRSDGSVVTWAKSPQGTIQAPTALSLPGPVQRVAVGGSNLGRFTGYAVLEDGTVVAWGANDEGQLGNGAPGADVTPGIYPKPSIAPVRVTGLRTSSTWPPATGMPLPCAVRAASGHGAPATMARSAGARSCRKAACAC